MKNTEYKTPIRSIRVNDELWLRFKSVYGKKTDEKIRTLMIENLDSL